MHNCNSVLKSGVDAEINSAWQDWDELNSNVKLKFNNNFKFNGKLNRAYCLNGVLKNNKDAEINSAGQDEKTGESPL